MRRWQHAARGHERGSTRAPDSGDEQPQPSSAAPSASASAAVGLHSCWQPPGGAAEQAPASARARACADIERMRAGPTAAAGTGHAGSVVEARAPQEQAAGASDSAGAPCIAGTAAAWPPDAEMHEALSSYCRVPSRAPVVGLAHAGPGTLDSPHEQGTCGSTGAGLAPSERTAIRAAMPADPQANPHPTPGWQPERAIVDTGAAETVCRVLCECSLVAAMHPDQVRPVTWGDFVVRCMPLPDAMAYSC